MTCWCLSKSFYGIYGSHLNVGTPCIELTIASPHEWLHEPHSHASVLVTWTKYLPMHFESLHWYWPWISIWFIWLDPLLVTFLCSSLPNLHLYNIIPHQINHVWCKVKIICAWYADSADWICLSQPNSDRFCRCISWCEFACNRLMLLMLRKQGA